MSDELVERIVRATLYEGYMLYPYRATSVKNRVRWTFGGVHPQAYSEATGNAEPWSVTTETLLLDASDDTEVAATVRFLRPLRRTVVRAHGTADATVAEFDAVAELHFGDTVLRSWEEATEAAVDAGRHALGTLAAGAQTVAVPLPASRAAEPVHDADGVLGAVLVRDQDALLARVTVTAVRLDERLHRVTVHVANHTPLEGDPADRPAAMRRSLVSTHAILTASGGTWLSVADPPECAREAASACRNAGLWPILVGDGSRPDVVLASPIILEDHPEVAPESPGDLFDSTEIDEILTLRILTLTDGEKAEMRSVDPRSSALLDRTEALTADDMMRMHGTLRHPRPPRVGGL